MILNEHIFLTLFTDHQYGCCNQQKRQQEQQHSIQGPWSHRVHWPLHLVGVMLDPGVLLHPEGGLDLHRRPVFEI